VHVWEKWLQRAEAEVAAQNPGKQVEEIAEQRLSAFLEKVTGSVAA
jgi:hypothetical protein